MLILHDLLDATQRRKERQKFPQTSVAQTVVRKTDRKDEKMTEKRKKEFSMLTGKSKPITYRLQKVQTKKS